MPIQGLTVSSLRFVAVAAVAASLAALPCEARAGDKAAADALFDKALKELNAGDNKNACDDFAASNRADPSVGALINLGKCNEKLGNFATSWSSYKSAESLARQHDDKRADDAHTAAAGLEAKLSYLKITAKAGVPGLTILRDGADTGGVLNTDLPIDPGEHTIEAGAAGYVKQTFKVKIGPPGDRQTLNIPEFVVDKNAAAPGGGGSNGDSGDGGSGFRIGGAVAATFGGLGLITGIAFGALAIVEKTKVTNDCKGAGSTCTTQAGRDELSTAKTYATVSTVGIVAGGILVVGGTALSIVGIAKGAAKRHRDEKASASWVVVPAVAPTMAGVVVAGSF